MASEDVRRFVPATDAVMVDARLREAIERLGPRIVKRAVHAAQDRVRAGEVEPASIADETVRTLPDAATTLQPILNATGVVLHTNLGRASLSDAAVEAVRLAAGYVDVEYDVTTGRRAGRGRGALEALREAVPAAAATMVVNNGAAALLLAATALAQGREILISRGELVEIGDGFRLPELLESTGARLRGVGTTNRTHLSDFAAAVSDETAFVLKVHPSNFAVRGFTASVGVRALSTLGVPVVADIGSGLLAPEPRLPGEPDAATWLKEGADLVMASGDKLLGGPQAGVVLGDVELVGRMRRHPMYRALRVDKLTLAALEATLRGPATPTRKALFTDPDRLERRARSLADYLSSRGVDARAVASAGLVGAGGAPEQELAGWAIAVPAVWAEPLRSGSPSVVGRAEGNECLLDLRCIPADADGDLARAVLRVASMKAQPCT